MLKERNIFIYVVFTYRSGEEKKRREKKLKQQFDLLRLSLILQLHHARGG